MVDVVHAEDGTLLLDADPEWAGTIYAVLETNGVEVKEIRKETMAERLTV